MTEGFVKHIVKKTGLVTEEKEEEKKEEEERYLQPVEVQRAVCCKLAVSVRSSS